MKSNYFTQRVVRLGAKWLAEAEAETSFHLSGVLVATCRASKCRLHLGGWSRPDLSFSASYFFYGGEKLMKNKRKRIVIVLKHLSSVVRWLGFCVMGWLDGLVAMLLDVWATRWLVSLVTGLMDNLMTGLLGILVSGWFGVCVTGYLGVWVSGSGWLVTLSGRPSSLVCYLLLRDKWLCGWVSVWLGRCIWAVGSGDWGESKRKC